MQKNVKMSKDRAKTYVAYKYNREETVPELDVGPRITQYH